MMTSEEPIRLQKFLSQHGVCSRREADNWIRYGRVEVNGKEAILGQRVVSTDTIALDGKILEVEKPERCVLAWFKPKNVETTLAFARDQSYRTLNDFDFGNGRLFSVGRLDKDSWGLLFLTNDGELANELTHPSYQKEKEYIVRVDRNPTDAMIEDMRAGIVIDGRRTARCDIERVEEKTLRFVLKEGRNRQIRRTCESVGLEVIDLLRTRIGDIELGDMKVGDTLDVTNIF